MARQSVEEAARPPVAEKQSRLRQRQKLIDACISALYLHGPSRTTIDKVVAIADMSPGIVNFYFETKAALLVAALEHLAVEFEERVCKPLDDQRESPVQALERLIALYLDPDIASPRKVSVWYAFWGEASSRQEYYDICGKRDLAFAALVRDLMARLIRQSGAAHLDADAIALGLIGSLEMIWQEIAFQEEGAIDRAAARARCQAYLRSVFPAQFSARLPWHSATYTPTTLPPPLLEDACKALVAAELVLAGIPALAAPTGWPGYDILAQPSGQAPQRILVRVAHQAVVQINNSCAVEWLAILSLPQKGLARSIYLIPGATAEQFAHNGTIDISLPTLAQFRGNLTLAPLRQ